MSVQETVSIDRLDRAVHALADLEAKGVRVRPAGGGVSASGDQSGLTENERAWMAEHQRDLAALLEIRPISPPDQDPSPERIFALAPSQVGMWTGASNPDPAVRAAVAATNQSIRLLCLGPLDVEALERAFRRVVMKHPSLRSRIEREAPRQGFHPVDEMRVAHVNLSGLDEKGVRARLLEQEQSACDFFGGKLARATLYRLGERRHVFQLVCNHVVIDGWSAPIVTRDLIAAYAAGPGSDDSWRQEGRLYFGYLDWEESPQRKSRMDLAARRWRRWLSEAPSQPVSVRLDRPRTGEPEFCDAFHSERLDSSVRAALDRAGPALGLTPGTVVAAAIMLLLAEESGCDTPVALMLDSGRFRPEQARLCGFLATPLPLSIRIDRTQSLKTYAARVGEAMRERRAEPLNWAGLMDAYPHRPAANPDNLAAVAFNVVNFDMLGAAPSHDRPRAANQSGRPAAGVPPDSQKLRLAPMPVEYQGNGLPGDLGLNLNILGQLGCGWNYNSRLIEPATLRRLSLRLGDLLTLICAAPFKTVAEALEGQAPPCPSAYAHGTRPTHAAEEIHGR